MITSTWRAAPPPAARSSSRTDDVRGVSSTDANEWLRTAQGIVVGLALSTVIWVLLALGIWAWAQW